MKPRQICVYCGSSTGQDEALTRAAATFGQLLAEAGVGLVYGGASIGIMGVIAKNVLQAGGQVTGVIPHFLSKAEVPLWDVSELVMTNSMHERKQIMFERSDAFVAFPGGIGTLEELFEMITWAQLGRHDHPIVIANINGFWDPLVDLLDHVITTGFAKSSVRQIYSVVHRVEDILPRIEAAL